MRANANVRKNNIDGDLEAHNRRQDFRDKRQVARLRKRTANTTAIVYARIHWECGTPAAGLYDSSEGQLVDSTGANLSPTALIWIESPSSCTPQYFGDVYYIVDKIGTATRTNWSGSSLTRDLYRAICIAPGSGTGTAVAEVEGADSTDVTKVRILDASHSHITTTINSSAQDNTFELVGGTTAYSGGVKRFDMLNRPLYRIGGSGSTRWLQIIPDHFQTGRRRSGFGSVKSNGSTTVSVATSIDFLETFEIEYLNGTYQQNGTAGGISYGRGILYCKNNGDLRIDDGGDHGVAIWDPDGSIWGVNIVEDAGLASNFGITMTVLGFTGSGITTQTFTISCTITGSRITAINFSTISHPIVFIVRGGRPSWTGE